MRIYWKLMGTIVIPLLVSACSMVTADLPHPTPTSSSAEATPTKAPPVPVDNVEQAATPVVQKAHEHLARKLSLSTDKISLFSVEAITWPDSSLGCPQSGMASAQVATPGYLILFETGGKTYTYHTDTSERIVLCEVRGPGEIYNPP